MTKTILIAVVLLALQAPPAAADWFDDLKAGGNKADLYRTLYYMPKGGDLHNHLSGAGFPEWWYELALEQEQRGYRYYTKVRINNCREYGGNEFAWQPYYLMFVNIMQISYERLSECEKGEYERLDQLDETQKAAWMNSIRLDQPHEGREEFFQTHWQRLNALLFNPWIQAGLLAKNIKAFSAEGLSYLELQVDVRGAALADGTQMSSDEIAAVLRERMQQKDILATGMMVRFQLALLRFTPNAEEQLRFLYKFVYDNNDLFVAVNMVGREDNDKGHPRRFLSTLRELRQRYGGVKLSIHAGEVDEPNSHVRETLLLGADRIGHGLNLISDDDTMRLMRHGPYLVEINLISNMLLGYVQDYSQHPFPEFLRTGIPVALSTDDRGMWDSTMTDEFFVATTEFNLSWDEVKQLSRNSLAHAFVSPEDRQALLGEYNEKILRFERKMKKSGVAILQGMPETRSFVCKRYELCF